MKSKKGISLIVLIVTIIVIIILAAAVILTLNNNNPVDSSRIGQLAENRANLNHAINMYYGKKMAETQGAYETKDIFIKNVTWTTAPSEGAPNAAYDKVYADAIKYSIGVTELTTGSKYYTLVVNEKVDGKEIVKETFNAAAPSMAGATWYIDADTGLVYLVYEGKDKVPNWMFKDAKAETKEMDTTLDEFVRIKNTEGNDLVKYSDEKAKPTA